MNADNSIMQPDQVKAANYIQQLNEARCEDNWDAVPELVRKVRKHAPERACTLFHFPPPPSPLFIPLVANTHRQPPSPPQNRPRTNSNNRILDNQSVGETPNLFLSRGRRNQ